LSLDHLNKNSSFKAVNVFIFGGSATIGTMNSGFKVEKILEISNTMREENAYHFIKNFNNIPIIDPKDWEKKSYLSQLKNENIDLMVSNCPCSSLSSINRWASIDGKNNIHFYRFFNIIKESQPKTFLVENSPNILKLGYNIILKMIDELSENYFFTVIKDYAGNHGVAMKRQRALVIGWNKKYFKNIPIIKNEKKSMTTIKEIIGDLYEVNIGTIANHELYEKRKWQELEHLIERVTTKSSLLKTIIRDWEELKDTKEVEKYKNTVLKAKEKLEKKENIWDKSPYRDDENLQAASISSVSEFIHPIKHRQFTIREYARLMGYPDDFIFYPNECKTDIIQTIAQGVPAKFVEYVCSQIKNILLNECDFYEHKEDTLLCFQNHHYDKYCLYSRSELEEKKELDLK
jgi:DNA (cytosine-5)-methyltransferase 1